MRSDRPIEGRILDRFIAKVEADDTVPPEVAERLRQLRELGQIQSVELILRALREGIEEHAKNSPA